MPAIDPESGIFYESAIFPDRHLEISYTEEADRGEGVARIQTMVVDNPAHRLPEEWATFVAAMTALVDAARLIMRDPPETIPLRGR